MKKHNHNTHYPTFEKTSVKCCSPRLAWICGQKHCKSDGVLSPNILFSEKAARAYWRAYILDSLMLPECGLHKLVEDYMHGSRIEMPCGHCALCQMKKRKDMSVRLQHETLVSDTCCFVTLTYNEDSIPCTNCSSLDSPKKNVKRGLDTCHRFKTLLPSDVQKFVKRLRRHLEYVPVRTPKDVRDHVESIRYFAVGEYGTKSKRPHYHLIIFGWSPSDMDYLFSKGDVVTYTSKQVQKLWKFGFSTVQKVTPQVARYCARYVTKKFSRLERDPLRDVIVPEFTLQSIKNGGIGAPWFDKFGEDSCKLHYCVTRCGDKFYKSAVPSYYLHRLRKSNLQLWLKLRKERLDFVSKSDGYLVEDLARIADCFGERLKKEVESEIL